MARNQAFLEGPDVVDVDFDDTSEIENDNADIEAQIAAEFEGDKRDVHYKIKVYRAGQDGAKDIWLFDGGVKELPRIASIVLERYGTGDYAVRVYKNGKLTRRFLKSVEAPRTITPPPVEATAIAQALNNQTRMIEGLIEKVANSKIPVQQDAGNSMQQTMALVASVMGMVKEFMPKPQESTQNQMDIFFKGMEMSRELQSNGDSNIWDVVKSVMGSGILEKLADNTQQQGRLPYSPQVQHNPRQVNSPSQPPLNRQAAPEPYSKPESEQDIMFKQAAVYIVQLITQAKKGSDPAIYADVILDNIPPQLIVHFIQRPNLKEDLVKLNQEVGAYWSWFAELLRLIKEALTDEGYINHNDAQTDINADSVNVKSESAADNIDGPTGRGGGGSEDIDHNVATDQEGEENARN